MAAGELFSGDLAALGDAGDRDLDEFARLSDLQRRVGQRHHLPGDGDLYSASGRHLDTVALQVDEPFRTALEALFFVIPHLEFFDVRDLVIHNWPSISWVVVFKATGYGAAYGAFFLLAAALGFRRKAL